MNWISLALAVGLAFTYQSIPVLGRVICCGEFEAISASEFVAHLSPGWNLGNSLDAIPNEDSWNNEPVTESTFDDVKNAGFNSVRIPVTWAYHFTGNSDEGDSPDWTVDPAWLQRVHDVVDMVTSRHMSAIINIHHDSTLWADYTAPNANITMIEEKFYRLWYQIGEELACTGSRVAFEPLHEPQGATNEYAAQLTKLNDIFQLALTHSGGFNRQRVVALSGPLQDIDATIEWFRKPAADYTNPYFLQVHYYEPRNFTSAAWGKTTWGSKEEKNQLEDSFSLLRQKFPDIPILIGEWLVSPVMSEPAARWQYYDFIGRMCAKYKFACMIWDTGNDILDRNARTLFDSTGLQVHQNALKGITNSLPWATTKPDTEGQYSSALIFHRIDDLVYNRICYFDFNGNNVTTIAVDRQLLTEGPDYFISSTAITFHPSFLSNYFNSSSEEGVKATVLVSFSTGARIPIQLIVWDAPTVPVASSAAEAGSEVPIAINWNGFPQPAAVAAFKADGTPLVDEWTVYLPPLNRGRTVFGAHWTWSRGDNVITITGNTTRAVVKANQEVTFMIEVYPRIGNNYVNYTLTI
ncbi:endoglucanase D precursor [Ilyonectria sp. MPI-CAGE-AT-0026]|nr:endoglucanase D precursor [Ilyonectria sp. MPI-CAGE-AT-0026]